MKYASTYYINENLAGDIGPTGLFQKGFNKMGITFKGTAKESFAVLLAYFRDETKNPYAKEPLSVVGDALNTMITRDKNKVSVDDEGGQWLDVDTTKERVAYDMKQLRNKRAAQKASRRAAQKGGTKAASKVSTKAASKVGAKAFSKGLAKVGGVALKAISGPVGWVWLGMDLVNDGIDLVQACKANGNPASAPKRALDTLYKFFNSSGKSASNESVMSALSQLARLVEADEKNSVKNKRTNNIHMNETAKRNLVKRITRQVIAEERQRQMLNENPAAIIKWLPQIITLVKRLLPFLQKLVQNPKFSKYAGTVNNLSGILSKIPGGFNFGGNNTQNTGATANNANNIEYTPYEEVD